MASLDLNPDINLMLVQAAVFASNLYVVNRFLVKPYLKLQEARSKETQGVKSMAREFEKESSSLERDINNKLKDVLEEASQIRANIQRKAEQDYNDLVAKARKVSEEEVAKVLSQIQTSVSEARKQLAKESEQLVPIVCKSLLA